jgi:hypothetical protein
MRDGIGVGWDGMRDGMGRDEGWDGMGWDGMGGGMGWDVGWDGMGGDGDVVLGQGEGRGAADLALWLRVDACHLKVLEALVHQPVEVPFIVRRDWNIVRHSVEHIELLHRDRVDLLQTCARRAPDT